MTTIVLLDSFRLEARIVGKDIYTVGMFLVGLTEVLRKNHLQASAARGDAGEVVVTAPVEDWTNFRLLVENTVQSEVQQGSNLLLAEVREFTWDEPIVLGEDEEEAETQSEKPRRGKPVLV